MSLEITLNHNQTESQMFIASLNLINIIFQIKSLNAEFKGVKKLIKRSGLSNQWQFLSRDFHTSILHFEQQKDKQPDENKKSDNSDKKPKVNKEEDDKNKNDNEEKVMSVLTKAVLWMLTIYMLVAVASLLLPKNNRPEATTRYVSWNEFIHHMMAKGEVRELIVRPDMEMVTIILHDGAIVKGRRVRFNKQKKLIFFYFFLLFYLFYL